MEAEKTLDVGCVFSRGAVSMLGHVVDHSQITINSIETLERAWCW